MTYTNKYNFGEINHIWNPWRGCFKVSEACKHCYIYSLNTFEDIYYTFPTAFDNLPTGTIITVSLQSDFFLAEADKYRAAAWSDIRRHPNLIFLIITKRVDRIKECLPSDWGDGWENVIMAATVETQARADERIPILLELPIKHKWLGCTPLLESIDLSKYLKTGQIEHVEVIGEKSYNGEEVRPLKIEWARFLKYQCILYNTRLSFLFVGSNCILENGNVLSDNCPCYHSELADSLGISYYVPISFNLPEGNIVY